MATPETAAHFSRRPANQRAPAAPGAVSAPVGHTTTHCPQNVQPEARSVCSLGRAVVGPSNPGAVAPTPTSSNARPASGNVSHTITHRPQPTQSPGSRRIRPSVVASRETATALGCSARPEPMYSASLPSSHRPNSSQQRASGGFPYVHSSRVQPSRSEQVRQTCGCRARMTSSRSKRRARSPGSSVATFISGTAGVAHASAMDPSASRTAQRPHSAPSTPDREQQAKSG